MNGIKVIKKDKNRRKRNQNFVEDFVNFLLKTKKILNEISQKTGKSP